MIYHPKDIVTCPHCGKSLDEKAEDLVIPGRVGLSSKCEEECGWCNGWYTAERLSDGSIEVEKSGLARADA